MRVLIADDDELTLELLKVFVRGEAFVAEFVSGGAADLRRIGEGVVDVVVTDVRMPEVSGEQLLDEVKRQSPETPVLMMTAEPDIDEAVRMLRRGADDYIPKPIEQRVFLNRVRHQLERVRLGREVQELRQAIAAAQGGTVIVGNTPVLQNLLRRLPMTSQTDATVLLTGEGGTGKELFARKIHELSKRKDLRFVTVNCGALSDTLLESELFGYKRGAFTDAHRDTPGLVVEAEGGTLFLDEIGEVSLSVQVKLLRFLQSKEYKPLGSPQSEHADVRIIAATNRDLPKMVLKGTFREDLYYRLNIVPMIVPPLRERRADIPLLANFFLAQFRRQYDKKAQGFSPEAIARLCARDWPGNVRELENRVQQLVVLSNEEIVHDLDAPGEDGTSVLDAGPPFKDAKRRVVDHFEREYVRRALARHRGNVSAAAREALLDRKSFWLIARRAGITGADE
ncbi:MAG: sigma-54-dependent Fis family transcriptional regulator [Deltaproteobacteria bacterium]|nr:sigma-54-dependent Fis family transcriptional regulator [Deltaproteobacteria bacterium]